MFLLTLLHLPLLSYHKMFPNNHKKIYYLTLIYIQDNTLTGTLSSVDVATKENLQNLVKVGEELLKKSVSRVNLGTGVFEPINKMTNEEALIE
jgi:hypothetical protein